MARHLSNWLSSYEEYTAQSEAPIDFHRWTGIATLAGAVRRRVRLEMGYFRWYPNFFLCFVSPPGIVSKSTTADIGMSLLRRVEGIKFGPAIVTWQALITALSESREDYPDGSGSFVPMSALTIVASELGTLIQPGDQAILNALTDLYDGKDGALDKLTKGGGLETIHNPWITLVGCTTPSWIAENFTTYFIGGGFASRTLFIYAEHKRQLVAYPATRLASSHQRLAQALVDDLGQVSQLLGPFQMTPGARAWGEQWYRAHHASDNPLRGDPRFGGYFARKQTHIHKTAMIISLSRGSSLEITEADFREANDWVTGLEANMLAVFGEMNKEKVTGQMAEILSVIRTAGTIRRDTLYQGFLEQMGYTTFQECLNGLQQSGLVELAQRKDGFHLRYTATDLERKLRR